MAAAAAAILFCLANALTQVPSILPDPSAGPGNPTKPVQVYILAGQSNMVGMGDVRGARNPYTGVFFSADPAITDRSLEIYRVGKFKTKKLSVWTRDGQPSTLPLAKGTFEIGEAGTYRVHGGRSQGVSCSVRVLDQRPAPAGMKLKPGVRYPFQITGWTGTPPYIWLEKVGLQGRGDLEAVAKRGGMFPWLTDSQGRWTVRRDVYYQEARVAKDGKGSPLSATSNGKSIGPELGFGHVMGTFHDEQVLLIKTAMGNRSLGFDFRPPSSGRTDPNNKWESLEYKLMVEGVRKTLSQIEKVVPGYRGQGYKIAGFAWFQGHKDSGADASISAYEKHLVNLIRDVRKEFESPALPVVVATVGFGGSRMPRKFVRILHAQMAVGDPKKHPEFAGNVTSVDTRSFWREVDESPRSQDYHYNRNAETYMHIGDALGRAMVRLRGGQAEQPPIVFRNNPGTKRVVDETAAAIAWSGIVADAVIPAYVSNPRFRKGLLQEASGSRPQRANQFLRGAMFGLVNAYRAAGVKEYEWHGFGPNLDQIAWDHFSFDPVETKPKGKGSRYRKVTFPDGMAAWMTPDFDPETAAGWKRGAQPFGQLGGKLAALRANCTASFCRCGETPKSLWEKEVLLIRSTFALPPLKPGHRYRIVVGGSAHVNAGEGFALWINGKRLAESRVGVGRRQGGQPRGAFLYKDTTKGLGNGMVTLAAMSFLRFNNPRGPVPPQGHLTLRLEEQKIPPLR